MVFEGFFENIPESNTCRLRGGVTLDLSPGTFSFGTAAAPHTLNNTETGSSYYFVTGGGTTSGIYISASNPVASGVFSGIKLVIGANAATTNTLAVDALINNTVSSTSVISGQFFVFLGADTANGYGIYGQLRASVAGGNVTTDGAGVYGQVFVPDRAMTGTYFGVRAEITSVGNVSAVPAASKRLLGNRCRCGNRPDPCCECNFILINSNRYSKCYDLHQGGNPGVHGLYPDSRQWRDPVSSVHHHNRITPTFLFF